MTKRDPLLACFVLELFLNSNDLEPTAFGETYLLEDISNYLMVLSYTELKSVSLHLPFISPNFVL